jgi:hypothetical protein
MIRVAKSALEQKFTGQRLADYLSAGRAGNPLPAVNATLDFEGSTWLALAQKHGPPSLGYSVLSAPKEPPLPRLPQLACNATAAILRTARQTIAGHPHFRHRPSRGRASESVSSWL